MSTTAPHAQTAPRDPDHGSGSVPGGPLPDDGLDGLTLVPGPEVAELLALDAAPLPRRSRPERAHPTSVLLAALGLVVLLVFVALPLQVVADASLGSTWWALGAAVTVMLVLTFALRALLARVGASIPLPGRTSVPTDAERGCEPARGRHTSTSQG